MIINRQAVNEYLDRELASYTWMKTLRKETILAELKKFRVPPTFKTEPWLHQLVCFYIGMCEPRFLFMLDMGLGKTKILADLMTQALREKTAERALITVPRVINMGSWRDDLSRHSDLEPWTCDISDIEEKWDRLAYPKGDVSIIDYQGLCLAVTVKEKAGKKHKLVRDEKRIRHLQKLYDFIGIDESHYLKSHENTWFGIMRQITKEASHVYATTGTLFGKNPEDAWSQFYLVDRGETFGENLGLFRGAFFTTEEDPWVGVRFVYNPRRSGEFHTMLQNRSIRYDEDEVPDLDVPIRATVRVDVRFGEEQREHYMRALQGLINAQGGGDKELEAPWMRMRQVIAGYLAWKDGNGDHIVRFKQNPKLEALERLLGEMGDSKLVICHEYTETGKLITERLKELKIKHVWLYGGTKDKGGCRDTFMNDPSCRVFVMNSAAGGTGNDGLQKVARYMVFYESPPDPTVRKQTEKRIHRPGQRERVFIYDLVMKGSTDAGILEDLAAGRNLYESIVNGRRLKREILRG